MHPIRKAVGVGTVDPASSSAAERRQHSGWLLREAENASILALAAQGVAIKGIMRRTDKSRGLVRQVVRGARTDMFRGRMSSLDPFLTRLETARADGSHNGAALWRAMQVEGFTGGLRVVTEWATRKRKEDGAETRAKRPGKAPLARRIARMMTSDRDKPSKTVARTIAIIGEAVPDLAKARDLLDRFHRIIQHREADRLEQWIEDVKHDLLKSFVCGIVQDHAAVKAALTEPWSNGQTEGRNTKLKMVMRQMYGRACLDLLRARILGAA
jgi:transposase